MLQYQNGNALITLKSNGTRTIEFDDKLKLEYPLNVDIRVQSICPLGYNPNTGKAKCSFCHESATTDGVECDYDLLFKKLLCLPRGIELAIGCNIYTDSLNRFLWDCKFGGYVCNITINQAVVTNHLEMLLNAIKCDVINGLGISYRSFCKKEIPERLLNYQNTVIHVIAGIDDIDEIMKLKAKKILVLGEKDFGFNKNKVDLNSHNHKQWFRKVRLLMDKFDVVSFDNLALEQLKIERFLKPDDFKEFYQGEYSFYINAVNGTFSRSSRSPETTSWNDISVKQYFTRLQLCD